MPKLSQLFLILAVCSVGLCCTKNLYAKDMRPVNNTPYFVELKKQVEALAQEKWKSHIEPRMPRATTENFETMTHWETRLVTPLPAQWPQKNKDLIFYTHARGRTSQLHDGERVGPTWGKIFAKIDSTSSEAQLKFELITDQIKSLDTQGVRPLTQNEIAILQSNPLDLLFAQPSPAKDKSMREYFCLVKGLGNIPRDIIDRHPDFFKWLGC